MEILRLTIVVLLTNDVSKSEFISSLKKSLKNDHEDLNLIIAIAKKITHVKKRPNVIIANNLWFGSKNKL